MIAFGRGEFKRPHIQWPVKRCNAQAPAEGFICTRANGHTGRHSAGGVRDDDGMCTVCATWAQEVDEPCS